MGNAAHRDSAGHAKTVLSRGFTIQRWALARIFDHFQKPLKPWCFTVMSAQGLDHGLCPVPHAPFRLHSESVDTQIRVSAAVREPFGLFKAIAMHWVL